MPRPVSGEVYKKEIRVTPYDQEPITDTDLEPFIDHLQKIVLYCEGEPNGSPKLHYHGYIETLKSETWVRQMLRKLSHCEDPKVNGNVLFFTRNPHDNTFGYISKCSGIVVRKGYDQSTLDEWVTRSAEYLKQKEAGRKREQRTRQKELSDITDLVATELKDGDCQRNPLSVIARYLSLCHQGNVHLPTRSQLDLVVLKLLYPYDQYVVRSYYERSFERM